MRIAMDHLTKYQPEAPLTGTGDIPYCRLLAARGLENIMEQIALFEACLTKDTPFFQHFVDCMHGDPDDDTCAERILEDLIIFFREKALRLPSSRLTPIEREIMQQFERVQTQEAQDNMIRRWYWDLLPTLVQQDFMQAHGLKSAPGQAYLHTVTGLGLNV